MKKISKIGVISLIAIMCVFVGCELFGNGSGNGNGGYETESNIQFHGMQLNSNNNDFHFLRNTDITITINLWNPNQDTILSVTLSGTKYQSQSLKVTHNVGGYSIVEVTTNIGTTLGERTIALTEIQYFFDNDMVNNIREVPLDIVPHGKDEIPTTSIAINVLEGFTRVLPKSFTAEWVLVTGYKNCDETGRTIEVEVKVIHINNPDSISGKIGNLYDDIELWILDFSVDGIEWIEGVHFQNSIHRSPVHFLSGFLSEDIRYVRIARCHIYLASEPIEILPLAPTL